MRSPRPSPGEHELSRLTELVHGARRPLAIVGEGGWTAQAGLDIVAFARAAAIPVAASFRCQDYVDNVAEVYAGHAGIGMAPALSRRIVEADLLLAIGGRLGEIPSSGYSLLEIPRPRQRLVHVHPDPDELGAVYQPELGIVSGLPQFAAAVRERSAWDASAERAELVRQAHAEYEANLHEASAAAGRAPARRGHVRPA